MSQLFPIHWKLASGAERSGYIDCNGRLMAEFPYMRVSALGSERAFFADGSRWEKGLLLWGVMDGKGTAIAQPRFTSFKLFSERRAVASDECGPTLTFKFGYIDEAAEWVLKPILLGAYSFSEGAAYIQRESASSLWQLVDNLGNLLIDELALGGGYVRAGLAKAYVPETQLCGFRNLAGEWSIKAQFTGAKDFSEGLAAVLTGKPGKELVHFIDTAGRVVIEPSHYVSCESGFSDGFACVYRVVKKKRAVLAGYIDRSGQEVIPCEWGLAAPFSGGLAAVMDDKTRLWGFIDRFGKVVVPPKYGSVENFSGGLASVRITKRIGPESYINSSGDVVWEAGIKPQT